MRLKSFCQVLCCVIFPVKYFKCCSLMVTGFGDLNDSTIKSGLELISTLVKMIIGDENLYNKNADRLKREVKV